jgi:hypothetical protein
VVAGNQKIERTPLGKRGDKWKKYERACFSKIGQGRGKEIDLSRKQRVMISH